MRPRAHGARGGPPPGRHVTPSDTTQPTCDGANVLHIKGPGMQNHEHCISLTREMSKEMVVRHSVRNYALGRNFQHCETLLCMGRVPILNSLDRPEF